MLKTASGPKFNYLSGKKYSIDSDTAKEWSKSPDPACKIRNGGASKPVETPAPSEEISFEWVAHVNFGAKPVKPVEPVKAVKKFRPGAKK